MYCGVSSAAIELFIAAVEGLVPQSDVSVELANEALYLDCPALTEYVGQKLAKTLGDGEIAGLTNQLLFQDVINHCDPAKAFRVARVVSRERLVVLMNKYCSSGALAAYASAFRSKMRFAHKEKSVIRLLSDSASTLQSEDELSSSAVVLETYSQGDPTLEELVSRDPAADSFWRPAARQACLEAALNECTDADAAVRVLEDADDVRRIKISSPANAEKLAPLIALKLMNLVDLDLSKTKISSVHALAESMVASGSRLAALLLANNELGPDAMHDIQTVLRRLFIVSLDLSHNPIGPLGVKALAQGIESSQTLRNLNASYCLLQGETKLLCEAAVQSKITSLDISNNYSGECVKDPICRFLRKHQTQELRAIDCSLPLDVTDAIIAVLKERTRTRMPKVFLAYSSQSPAHRKQLALLLYPGASALQLRRVEEQQILYGADALFGSRWFLVAESWLQSWRAFVSGRSDVIPGRVDNSGIKRGVSQRVMDYRAVNQQVWDAIMEIYGGGPAIEDWDQ